MGHSPVFPESPSLPKCPRVPPSPPESPKTPESSQCQIWGHLAAPQPVLPAGCEHLVRGTATFPPQSCLQCGPTPQERAGSPIPHIKSGVTAPREPWPCGFYAGGEGRAEDWWPLSTGMCPSSIPSLRRGIHWSRGAGSRVQPPTSRICRDLTWFSASSP